MEQDLLRPVEDAPPKPLKLGELLEPPNRRPGLNLYDQRLDWYWKPQITFRTPEEFRLKFKKNDWSEGDLDS